MIRQTPGTISLGQGVVHYGPPQAALDAVRDALRDAVDPRVPGRRRAAGARRARSRRSCARRTASTWRAARRVMVTAGANMAFVHAVLAITAPGDEIILPVPFYFNHEMAIQMAGCTAVRVADRRSLSAAPRRAARGDHRSHARHRHGLAEQPERRRLQRGRAARGQRALPRSRALSHRRRGVRVLHLRRGAARVAGIVSRRRRPHDRDVLAVEGLRLRRLAHRLHDVSRAPRRRRWRRARTRSWSARRWRRRWRPSPRSRSDAGTASRYVRELAAIRDIVVSKLSALAPLATVPAADGAFYVLLQVETDARSDGDRRAADPRAQGRGDSRAPRSA